jgi:hypothetical protein
MRTKDSQTLARRQGQLDARLDRDWQPETAVPVLGGEPLCYELSERTTAIDCGGLGVMTELAKYIGLPEAIDESLDLLRRHRPYHESDHVLNMAFNIVVGNRTLEDLELLRNNLGYLDALGARRIPDPTTAGDFLRRFSAADVETLMDATNQARTRVWQAQPRSFRRLAIIDVDGTIAPTSGECKEGADFSYKGDWGYGPLVLSLANTQEVLYTVNRSAAVPSHSGSAQWLDKGVRLVREGGFSKVRLRGDTDFSLTQHFDRWTAEGVEFVFGMDANQHFVARAERLEAEAWKPLKRRAKGARGTPRWRPANVKQEKVREREFRNLRLVDEHIAEIQHTPSKAKGSYRLVILRKRINVEKGQTHLEDEIRYFFYITNVPARRLKTAAVVFDSNARCHQENLIEQMKNGVHATQMPTGDLVSNWAYMVIGSLAWNLKVWLGLILPKALGAGRLLKMEFRTFVNQVIRNTAQVLRKGRRIVYRLQQVTAWTQFLLDADAWFRERRFA